MKPLRILDFLVKFLAISFTIAQSINDECKAMSDQSARLRLKNYLFCRYDWTHHNGDSNNETIVTMDILPRYATMDEYYGNLELSIWMYITWNDEHLKWLPAEFENVLSLVVESSEIWTPDVFVQNLGSGVPHVDGLAGVHCAVRYDGVVGCAPRYHHTVGCQTDFTLWPYDRHNCTLVISSLSVMGGPIVFEPRFFGSKVVYMHDFTTSGQWEITVSRIAFEQSKSNRSQSFFNVPKVSVDFIADRAHGHLSGRYIMPAMLTTVMTLTTVWLDPRSRESLALACLNPVIHLLCIQHLNWLLPHSGNSVPNIVLFYMNSLVLVIVALLATIALSKLRDTKTTVPEWIAWSMSSVLKNRIGQVVLLGMLDPKASADLERKAYEDNDVDLVNSEPRQQSTWRHVVVFLSWIIFLVFFLTYVVMWATLVPNSSMKSPLVDVSDRINN